MATTADQIIPVETRNGSQSIQIPDEFAFSGDHVRISRDVAGRLVVEPLTDLNPGLIELLDSWEPLPDEESLPEIEDRPPEPLDL